ncbi:AlpA family transcriptional regulator [Frankia sp. ACN1ag]|uniref:helix-turn-helix transcriptional regulator n=1 Tax=Frankia sp. ACN1ag TaxID=102891 RepID=UPI00128EF878|nr:hypothetical protein [Frankia sp. ACN1ag]
MMDRREPTDGERQELHDDVLGLAWTWARRLADLQPADGPRSVYDGGETEQRAATAARGHALELLAEAATAAAVDDLRHAGEPPVPPAPAVAMWTRDQVLAHIAAAGEPISADTWSSYVSRGQAPTPTRHIGRAPVWDSAQVRAWQAARRGRGWRAGIPGLHDQETGS